MTGDKKAIIDAPLRDDPFPDISGEWAMEIQWARDNGSGKLIADAFIRQDTSGIRMTVRSRGSDSHTILVEPDRDRSGDPMLYYMYEVDPKATQSDAPGPYKGAAILHYYPHGELSGNYWTSRRTSGHFKLLRKTDATGTTMNDAIDVLLITAIPEEHEVARQVFTATELDGDGVSDWKDMESSANLTYYRGVFNHNGGPLFTIALANPLRMGGIETGQLAVRLADRLQPSCLVMCGVCAGNPKYTALGDLVVSEIAYQYDEGKRDEDGFVGDHRQSPVSDAWQRAADSLHPKALPSYGRPSPRDQRYWLLERLFVGDDPSQHPAHRRYFEKGEWATLIPLLEREKIIEIKGTSLKLTKAGRREVERSLTVDVDPPEQLPFTIKRGPIASGNVVVKDGLTWDSLKHMGVRSALGLDMEAAAIGVAARGAAIPEWIVIKGVMDHADPRKDDRYKPFAARASAEALRAFLMGRFLAGPVGRSAATNARAATASPAPASPTLTRWRPHVIDGPFFDELRFAMEKSARPLVGMFDLALEAAREARAQAKLALDTGDRTRTLLGGAIARTRGGQMREEPTILHAASVSEARSLIAKIWGTRDEYVGEALGDEPDGLGVLRVYALSEELTPSLQASYAGRHESGKYGPVGVFTFPDQSHFAGQWASGHPRFGYREYIGSRTELDCDFYLGAMQGVASYLTPLWQPHGDGIAVDATARLVRCGKLIEGKFDDIKFEFTF